MLVKVRIAGLKGDLDISKDDLAETAEPLPTKSVPARNGHCFDLREERARELVEKGIAVYEEDFRRSVSRSSRFLSLENIRVLNRDEVLGKLRDDLRGLDSKDSILIYCPFVGLEDCKRFLKMREVQSALKNDVSIEVVTRLLSDYKKRQGKKGEAIRELMNRDVRVYGRSDFHEKGIFVGRGTLIRDFVDGISKIETHWNVGYIGSANLLSYPSSSDVMVRFVNRELCEKVVEKIGLPEEDERF